MAIRETVVGTTTATAPARSLRNNAVGLTGVLFQSITLMGPGVAVAFALSPGITYAGGSFPLSLLLAMIGCILLALNLGQLAAHLPSAGSFYTYISRGLGQTPGFLAGWIGIPVYFLFIPLNLLALGFAVQGLSGLPWWIPGSLMAVVMGLVTFFGVRLSLRVLVVMGAIEIAVFLLLSIFLIANAPDGNMLQAFTFAKWPHGQGGLQGVLQGTVIAFLAFAGFESAASLAEESTNPRRNVPRAIFLSVILIGLFFVFASYAGLAGYGFNHIGTVADPHSYLGDNSAGTPWFTLADNVWGKVGGDIVGLVVLNSLAANIAAGYTALGRIMFAMGRAGALPSAFGRVHPRYRTPWLALAVAVPLSIGLAVWAAAVYGAPPNSFQLIVSITADFVLLAYIGISLAVPFYYRRERRGEWNLLRHGIIPIATALLLTVILVAQFFATVPPTNYPGPLPQYLGGAIAGGWLIAGVVWALILRARRPEALAAGERLYGATSQEADPVAAPAK